MISFCKNDPTIWQTPEDLIPLELLTLCKSLGIPLLVTEKMDAQTAKKEGNRLFTSGNHKDAIIKYTEAIDLDPTDVTFFSNRSAACGTVSRACSHNVNSK